ncbi:MAG TPA: anthranilate synthase component I family protein [Puia sp.]
MKRNYVSFPITDNQKEFIKQQMLTWAAPFNICCFLDNHDYNSGASSLHSVECLLAAGAVATLKASAGEGLTRLKEWAVGQQDWLFGHFAYELAAETETAGSSLAGPGKPAVLGMEERPDPIGFPDLFFFVPEILIELRPDSVSIGSFGEDQEAIWQEICRIGESPATAVSSGVTGATASSLATPATAAASPPNFIPRFTRDEYLATVSALRQHILRGDCYEINFCQEFFAQPVTIDPLCTWWSLGKASPNPFSAFYRLDDSYLLCASPERYLKKTGDILFSQPIKGTSARDRLDPMIDQARHEQLYNSPKDRSENVMVVDLVRNDLSRVCIAGSVRVTELFGIYAFPQVYQMISTVTGRLQAGIHWTDVIRNTFPMGSMTGAPKTRVVELIALYERSRRGIFSGAVGYVTPDGDFDFNVVIRSLMYNRENKYLSYQVGSGITFYSDPAAEYEECLVKAEGIRGALGNKEG